ncbi:kinase RLK-Pelle-CrRLK1L-1 family protein [Tanacetum coccineum]
MTLPVEFAHLKIPLEEIVKATKSFANENLIGQGGFGKVYKGTLSRSGESIHIVARRLHHDYGQGDIEFWTEIMMLASLKNENVVSIVRFCDEKDEKIIVNKYEAKGSLDKYLSGPTLTWMQRLKICVDVAHALKCIHDGRDFSIIHRNIKSSKILLDDNWKPMLSGFEVSIKNTRARRHRLLLAEVIGTIGPMW